MTLNARQVAFINAYTSGATLGNATQSAKRAGYRGDDVTLAQTGSRMLRNAKVSTELARRARGAERGAVMDAAERRALLTEFARDMDADRRDRIKSVELLAKMSGDFVERRELSGPNGGPLAVTAVPPQVARKELLARLVAVHGAEEGARLVSAVLEEEA